MLTKPELQLRLDRFYQMMNQRAPGWEIAVIVDRVNQYYFTGTMQDGVLILTEAGDVGLFVRKSYELACKESLLDTIYPMQTYRDILSRVDGRYARGYYQTEIIPYNMLTRLNKYLQVDQIQPLDGLLNQLRSVKTDYELERIRQAGHQHDVLYHQVIPSLLQEGMSEVDVALGCYQAMMKMGHQGITRFSMFQMEVAVGQISFGTHSIHPTNFNGPGGSKGLNPAAPIMGDRNRLLAKGDLVFVDIGFGVDGYHSDKTHVYMYQGQVPEEVAAIHQQCTQIYHQAASMLRPGIAPSAIYDEIIDALDPIFAEHFMGYKQRVPFLGHGVGLYMNDMPVIARRFDDPLQANMVIALEPKSGIEGLGMVGVEETLIVSDDGGICVTGGPREITVI